MISPAASAVDVQYGRSVNPQWVRLLSVLQMNVRYARCEGTELTTEDGRVVNS